MISPKKWIISQKYGRQGALQVNPLKAKGPQIQSVKVLAGGLLSAGVRTAYKLSKKKFPSLKEFKSKATKPVWVNQQKMKFKDLRKLALAETLQVRLQKMRRGIMKFHKDYVKKTKGAAGHIGPYSKINVEKAIGNLGKDFKKLSAYKTIKEAKVSTKHSVGGLIIGKNVDKDLL